MPDSFRKGQKKHEKASKRIQRKAVGRGGDRPYRPQGDSNVREVDAPESVTELESDPGQVSLPGSTTGSLQREG
jgi:hypothetical protein